MTDLKIIKRFPGLLILNILILFLITGHPASGDTAEYSLVFDADKFSEKTINVNNRTVAYRSYEGIVYVSRPVDTKYQTMNYFVPSEYYQGRSIGNYTIDTAPVFLPNMVGGYMPGPAGSPGQGWGNRPNIITLALARGYIVASPGARGRTLKDEKGLNTGKAPACIVDLKAAVRYLRYNDKIMPGDAEKIISNGTSAGGALSSLLGAAGNSPDYEPGLRAIGAAPERDNIFAASCYCPITNLENGDSAYEWLFNGINSYSMWGNTGKLNADQIRVSDQLKDQFPGYLNSLKLKKPDGSILTLDENGEGSFKEYVKSFVTASAQKALNNGKNLSNLDCITIKDGIVKDINLAGFIAYATRMKPPPAFDALELNSPENNLFGTETTDSQHFTKFAMDNSTGHFLADSKIIKMMNPMDYIGAEGIATAKYWRIRHGAVDRDTSLAIPVILAAKLQNNGFKVDFAMPWGQGHGGDYDPDELFAWIDMICSKSENR